MLRSHKYLTNSHDIPKSNIINSKNNNSLFEETSYRAIKVAKRRKWTLILFISIIVLICIGLLISNQMKNSKTQKLSQEYSSIEEIYNKEILDFKKKLDAKTENKNIQSNPDFTKSMELFSNFSKKYPSEPIAWQAAIRAGTYYIAQDLNEKAKEVLEPVIENATGEALIQISVRTSLAGIYVSEKNDQKALEELKVVEEIPQNPIPNQARFLRAQILTLSGNKTEAIKILNQIISNNQNKLDNPSSSNTFSNQNSQLQQQAKIWLNYLES